MKRGVRIVLWALTAWIVGERLVRLPEHEAARYASGFVMGVGLGSLLWHPAWKRQ